MGFFSNFFGGGGDSAPDFSNLGVTDPTTGKPVYLSANEISTVMGATGGVAPTKFQAGVEGFISGAEKGQDFIQGISNIQAQQQNIQASKAATEAQEIQNEIDRRTKEAQIQATNNQVQQKAIEAQIQTDKLTADNIVLQAVRSGDPQKLTDAISNPQTMLSAIDQDQYVQAAYGKLKAAGSFTPQQLAAFDKFNLTRDIYKQGPLQDTYQTAASAVAGSLPFQMLKQQSGLDTNTLLSQMQVAQVRPSADSFESGTALIAPNGAKVIVDDKDESGKLFSQFFSAKDKLQSAGRYKLPLGQEDQTVAVAPVQETPPQLPPVPNAVTPGAAEGAVPQVAPPAALPQPQPTATPAVNPSNTSPVGTQLQFNVPQLQGMNTKVTPTGESVTAKTMREAQQIYAMGQGKITPKDALAQATKIALKEVDLSAKAKKANATNTGLAQEYRDTALGIRGAVKAAEDAGVALGPTFADSFSRGSTSVDAVFDPTLNVQLGNVRNKFDTLASKYGFTIMKKDGLKAQVVNSNAERELLQAGGPRLTKTAQENLAVADEMDSFAALIQDKADLTSYFNVLNIPDDEAAVMIADYQAQNPALVFDPATNSLTLNHNRKGSIEWANEKLGIADEAALNAFSAPTTVQRAEPTQTPAPGSGSSTPFAPAQKTTPSPFPSPTQTPEARGVGYNNTPATQQDLKAIAQTVAVRGNIRQFQTGGSVPLKLDKATPDLVARVIGAESSGDPNAVSPTGVRGAMQVTKATFNEVASQNPDNSISNDRSDPLASTVRGTQYLNSLLRKYDGNVDLTLAAYNAGPGTVDEILEAQGLTKSRATIDAIGPYLPKTQDTVGYVKKITSRGRIAPETREQGNGGFFDNFNVNDLNPFAASVAEAQDSPPVELSIKYGKKDALPKGGAPGESDTGVTPEGPGPTTDAVGGISDMENSARNDVPPVSDLQAALIADGMEDAAINSSMFPTTGKAVKFIRNSPLGSWLRETAQQPWFKAGENYVNAATFGLYDEGMGAMNSALGFDGTLVQNEIRESMKEFRREYPKTAMASDILGSVAGGVGASKVLRALTGATAAASTFDPMTFKEGVKIGATQGAARGAGEGETVGQRVTGAAAGGVIGGALGGAAGGASNIPVVGAPAVAGAGVGAIAGGVTGGKGSDVLGGAALGATAGGGAALLTRFSPAIQKAITNTVVKLNNYEGLQKFAGMVQKLITGKTPAEAATTLDSSEAFVLDTTQHLSRGQVKGMLEELKNSKNPQVPQRLVDLLNDADTNSLVKAMTQLRGNKEVSAKINQFLQSRMTGQLNRLNDEVGPQDLVEQSARQVIGLIESEKKGATQQAIDATKQIFADAKTTTPVFDSPVIKKLLSTPAMKEAVAAARKDVEAIIPKNTAQAAKDSGLITDLSNKMFARVQAGQKIDDLIQAATNTEKRLADNSFDILTEARRKLFQQIEDPGTSNTLKLKLGDVHRELTAEMNRLSPGDNGFEGANIKYAAALARVDSLKTSQIEAITNLADGNVQLALGKIMRLPPKDLETLVNTVAEPEAFKDVARGYIRSKLDKAIAGKDVASKLVTQGEWKNLTTLLGEDEVAQLRSTIDAESRIAKSGSRMSGGSDTTPKLQAAETLDTITGQSNAPLGGVADVVQGSWMSMGANIIKKTLRAFKIAGDPAKLEDLADTLVLSAPKGVKALESVLKARGVQAAELRRMRPFLEEWHVTAQGGGVGIDTSLEGQLLQNNRPTRKKKK